MGQYQSDMESSPLPSSFPSGRESLAEESRTRVWEEKVERVPRLAMTSARKEMCVLESSSVPSWEVRAVMTLDWMSARVVSAGMAAGSKWGSQAAQMVVAAVTERGGREAGQCCQ